MNHTDRSHKPDEPETRRVPDQSRQSDYYYDDSTNYEIYHDDADEADEPDEDDS
jgi:hypothetical protein